MASKIFQNFISPLPIFLLVVFFAIILRDRRKKFANTLLCLGFIFILVLSNRNVSYWLLLGLEKDFPAKNYALYPNHEVVVSLGGTLAPTFKGRPNLEESNSSRLVPTYLFYKLGKVKKIIVSGGNPYLREDGVQRTEADDMTDFLVSLGVAKGDIIKESTSRNTQENALEVAKILRMNGWVKPLLITSAFHMKRAVFLFEKYGVSVTPVAVAHRATLDHRFWYLNFIPSVNALETSSLAIKERLGILRAFMQ